MHKHNVIRALSLLVDKPVITLTESGDDAIRTILKQVKNIGKTTIFIQDQGGWLTYRDYAKKENLSVIELKTDYGIIQVKDLEKKATEQSVVLINSLTGYCAEQPMNEIARVCRKKKCVLINDVSGSIGTDNAKRGDIILGSFGKNKPINLHYGGFIAGTASFEGVFDATKLPVLYAELIYLPEKLARWKSITITIKKELCKYPVIHRDHHGINVIVKFNNGQEKQELTTYCEKKQYPYTMCPRTIRVNENAISIEVKQLQR